MYNLGKVHLLMVITYEEKRVLILLSLVVKRMKTQTIKEVREKLVLSHGNNKEELLTIILELKESFGLNISQAKEIVQNKLPKISQSMEKFVPAYENLITLLRAIFFYDLSNVNIDELGKQLTTSLCAFGANLVTAKFHINDLHPE